MLINLALTLIIMIGGYVFWIRPILKKTPALEHFFETEGSYLAAISGKLAGIKQRLAGAVVTIACLVVGVEGQLVPLFTGVDLTPITAMVPAKAWPWIMICVTLLLNYFRSLADKRGE